MLVTWDTGTANGIAKTRGISRTRLALASDEYSAVDYVLDTLPAEYFWADADAQLRRCTFLAIVCLNWVS